MGDCRAISGAHYQAAPNRDTICTRFRSAETAMNVHLQLKITGALLIALGLTHSFFGRYFKRKAELAQLSLLTRQIFLVHCLFISLAILLIGACTLFYTNALLSSGTLSRVMLTGFAVFWLLRLVFQISYTIAQSGEDTVSTRSCTWFSLYSGLTS